MGRGDEGGEVGGFGGVRSFLFGEDLLEAVRVVGDEAVDAEVDERADFFGVVGGPGDDTETGFVKFGHVDGGVGAKDGRVDGRERGRGRAVSSGVGVGCGEEAKIGFGCRHSEEEDRSEGGGSDGD
jgi:hypothetical protein